MNMGREYMNQLKTTEDLSQRHHSKANPETSEKLHDNHINGSVRQQTQTTKLTRKKYSMRQLFLIGSMVSVVAFAQSKPVVATHCKPDERIVFSCPFKPGKTASLCASSDLTKTTGTLQYRYGVVGKKPELMFPDLEERTVERNHPKNWFDWSSSLWTPQNNGRGSSIHTNKQWSTKNVPLGNSVNIHMTFTPIDGRPDVNFVIDAQVGPELDYQGTMLTIYESGGQGRIIAEHRCIKEKTTEDLFSLKDIIQK